MAIDSSLFMADIPAGTYAVGDVITLNIKAGPSVVRSGRGAAYLKRLTTGLIGQVSGSTSYWKISVKNSDWIDEMCNLSAAMSYGTALDERSGCVQRGNDCPLTPNSSWQVVATCVAAATTTVANSIFALIDIDYPAVSSIVDPDSIPGIPTSISYLSPQTVTYYALGTSASAAWFEDNVDFLKAGYEYALQKIEGIGLASANGFIALANAAGMSGLCRMIPISANIENIRNKVEYATKLVKGPMDVRFLLFADAATSTTGTPNLLLDFVKRKVA